MNSPIRRRALIALALAAVSAPSLAMAPERSAPISESEIRAHIAVLASDAFEGRAPGTAGESLTIDYLARTWAEYGLVSGTNDPAHPWFQPVPLVERKPFAQTVRAMRGKRLLTIDSEAMILSGRNSSDRASGTPLFVGYGVTPDGTLNADVRGRIVIMLMAEPKFEGAVKLPTGREREKMIAQAGAAAVLLAAADTVPWQRLRAGLASGATRRATDDPAALISGWLRADASDVLMKPAGLSLLKAIEMADAPGFAPLDLPVTLDLATSTQVRAFDSYNVIAKLPGAKPGAGAVLMLGHWDHLGICRGEEAADRICNGAVDNASGMAVLLTVAERLARSATVAGALDRDIYFMGTTAEERGLLGAYHFADQPNVPLDQIVVALNIDTIAIAGKDAPVAIVGRGETGLDDIVDQVAIAGGRTVDTDLEANAFVRRQDGWALAAKGVKSIMAGGSFADMQLLQAFLGSVYHQPGDELTDATPLAGAADDANLHVDLARHFADEAKYTPAPTGD